MKYIKNEQRFRVLKNYGTKLAQDLAENKFSAEFLRFRWGGAPDC